MIEPTPGRRSPLRAMLIPAMAGMILVTGCGAQVTARQGAPAPVKVARCAEEVEYHRPQRTVVYEAGSADKMFVLGLTDHVAGYVMPPANPPVTRSPWAAEYAKVKMLSDDLLNRELVVDAKADLVVAGWQSGFSDQRGITPEILDGLGIQSFMHSETCYNYPDHPFKVAPFQGLYTDLERLGAIFGAQDRARRVTDQLKKRVAAVREQAPKGYSPRVFLYDSGTDQPFTSGNQAPPHEIIETAGGTNIFGDLDGRWTSVGWEAVVKGQPEIIMILDYGDKPAKEKIAFLKSSPRMRSVPAVRHDRFHIIDYNEAISGPRIVDGLEKFGAYLRELER
ncbi:ABC transporter substrate-binding protein [Streptosporangium soli]|nr:ABC transporter substrate-binding protein [Streptosporangium sp. KLBMP 9127]